MTRITTLVLASVLTIAVSATAYAGQVYVDELFGVQVTTDVQYGSGATGAGNIPLLADIYHPVDIGNGPIPVNRPAIVIQDGGAWTSARKNRPRVTMPAQYLAQRGYTVIVTDYRQGAPGLPFGLADPGPHAPVTVGQTTFGTAPYAGITAGTVYGFYPGINPIRAGIEDFAVAIDWTRTNAAALGIDPNRIGIAGGSAGGIDALLLQYNNNSVSNNGLTTVDPRYAAQAVVALVSTMDGNHGRIQAGGPPVFLLNNTADVVVPWSAPMSQRFADVGIYREQWYQPTDAVYHDVDWNAIPNSVASATPLTTGPNLLERVRDFLIASELAEPYLIPEPSTYVLGLIAAAAFLAGPMRKRLRK